MQRRPPEAKLPPLRKSLFPLLSRVVDGNRHGERANFQWPRDPRIRIADVTEKGFLIRLNELMAGGKALGDGRHTEETVGWIASTV